jgi:hypothetical protein
MLYRADHQMFSRKMENELANFHKKDQIILHMVKGIFEFHTRYVTVNFCIYLV